MGRVCVGRLCYGPSLQWTEFAMGRGVQLSKFSVPSKLQNWDIAGKSYIYNKYSFHKKLGLRLATNYS